MDNSVLLHKKKKFMVSMCAKILLLTKNVGA